VVVLVWVWRREPEGTGVGVVGLCSFLVGNRGTSRGC
jgi:hypothetical protein